MLLLMFTAWQTDQHLTQTAMLACLVVKPLSVRIVYFLLMRDFVLTLLTQGQKLGYLN